MSTPNKPTRIERPEQVESLIAGAPLSVTNGVTWPGGRGVSPLSNAAEWFRKCSEMTKAIEDSQKMHLGIDWSKGDSHTAWQTFAEPSWSDGPMPDLLELLQEAKEQPRSERGPVDFIAMRRADFERIGNSSGWRSKEDQAAFKTCEIYGVPVHVFETAEECFEFRTIQWLSCRKKVLVVAIEEDTPKLPFELGKTRITIAKPSDEHQRFSCYPMRIEDGKLICCIQNDRSGWWEDWNLEHTISGIKSGFYKVERCDNAEVHD